MGTIKNLIQGSQEWKDYRKNRVGASDIGAIMGAKGAFSTRKKSLLDRLQPKLLNSYTENLFAQGHEWERSVIDFMNTQRLDKFAQAVFQDDLETDFMASLDGWCELTQTVVEVKLTTKEERFKSFQEKGLRESMECYWLQAQWQLMITGGDRCIFVMGLNGDAHQEEILPCKDMWLEMRSSARAFLDELRSAKSSGIDNLETRQMMQIAELKKTQNDLKKAIDDIDEQIKSLADEVMTEFEAVAVMGCGVKIEWIERKGAIKYADIPELEGVDLEKYRGKETKYIKVSIKEYKQEKLEKSK